LFLAPAAAGAAHALNDRDRPGHDGWPCSATLKAISGVGRGPARLVGVLPYTGTQRLEREPGLGEDWDSEFKCDDMRSRPGTWSAAEGTIVNSTVAADRLMPLWPGHVHVHAHRADLQAKRRAGRRHEAHRDVCPEQECQHQ
jgi:hypothetical protein